MIGTPQIICIIVVVVLLFGAKRIPELAGSIAKGIKEFKKVGKESDDKEVITDNKSESNKEKDKS